MSILKTLIILQKIELNSLQILFSKSIMLTRSQTPVLSITTYTLQHDTRNGEIYTRTNKQARLTINIKSYWLIYDKCGKYGTKRRDLRVRNRINIQLNK